MPGDSCTTVNGRNTVNYDGKRRMWTGGIYDHRVRCVTTYHDHRKPLPQTTVVYGKTNNTAMATIVVFYRKTSYTSIVNR